MPSSKTRDHSGEPTIQVPHNFSLEKHTCLNLISQGTFSKSSTKMVRVDSCFTYVRRNWNSSKIQNATCNQCPSPLSLQTRLVSLYQLKETAPLDHMIFHFSIYTLPFPTDQSMDHMLPYLRIFTTSNPAG